MIRTAVRQHLADRIAQSGIAGSADVSACYPGDKHTTAEMIFGDRTTGSVTFPYGMASPRIQRDQFAVVFVVRVTARPDVADAMARRDELANHVATILADDASLLGFEADGERVTDTNPDGQGIQVDTREGENSKGVTLALAEITVPIETQTLNTES